MKARQIKKLEIILGKISALQAELTDNVGTDLQEANRLIRKAISKLESK